MATTDLAAGDGIQAEKRPKRTTTIHSGRRYLMPAMAAILLTGISLVSTSVSASATTTRSPFTCAGSSASPAPVPGGTYSSVTVTGVCAVNDGQVVVTGSVTVSPGAALVVAFAHNDVGGSGTSGLTVDGNIEVGSGASLLLGCEAAHFACIDDPNQNSPTLNAAETVKGSVVATEPLGVILHLTTVGGDATQTGGGGGLSCTPSGIFAKFGSPVYSDYEDNTVDGNMRVTGLTSCWLGGLRNKVGGSVTYSDNTLADPDANEILTNQIAGNFLCSNNSPVMEYGDSAGSPNTVGGFATGQCAFSVKQPNPAPVPGKGGNAAGPLSPISVHSSTPQGYWLTAGDGGVFSFGVPFFGFQSRIVSQPVTGIAAAPGGSGYNVAEMGGAVYAHGTNASDCTGLNATTLNAPVVGIAAAPGGNGCWLAAADGGVFSFGSNAPFFGSAGGLTLNQPIVGIAATPNNDGYYLVAADGGVFAYGPGATFHGSMGGQHLNQPIVGITVDPSTGGYWLVAADGGVFSFDAPFLGSMGGTPLNKPVVGIAAAPTGEGYYLVASDGGIFALGPGATFQGSTGGVQLNKPVVGMSLG